MMNPETIELIWICYMVGSGMFLGWSWILILWKYEPLSIKQFLVVAEAIILISLFWPITFLIGVILAVKGEIK